MELKKKASLFKKKIYEIIIRLAGGEKKKKKFLYFFNGSKSFFYDFLFILSRSIKKKLEKSVNFVTILRRSLFQFTV